jgi:hypothetical protein
VIYFNLGLYRLLLFVDTSSTLRALSSNSTGLGEFVLIFELGTMDIFFENGFGIDLLKLGLEVAEASFVAAAIGTTTLVGHSESGICYLLALDTPKNSFTLAFT